jgi:hypothetical protein
MERHPPGIGKKQLYVNDGSVGGTLLLLPVPIPSDLDGDFVEELQRHEHDEPLTERRSKGGAIARGRGPGAT